MSESLAGESAAGRGLQVGIKGCGPVPIPERDGRLQLPGTEPGRVGYFTAVVLGQTPTEIVGKSGMETLLSGMGMNQDVHAMIGQPNLLHLAMTGFPNRSSCGAELS